MRIGGIDFSMGVDLTKNSAGHHFFSASDHSNNSSLSANYENVRHTLSEIKGESEAMEKVLQTVIRLLGPIVQYLSMVIRVLARS